MSSITLRQSTVLVAIFGGGTTDLDVIAQLRHFLLSGRPLRLGALACEKKDVAFGLAAASGVTVWVLLSTGDITGQRTCYCRPHTTASTATYEVTVTPLSAFEILFVGYPQYG